MPGKNKHFVVIRDPTTPASPSAQIYAAYFSLPLSKMPESWLETQPGSEKS